MNNPPGNSTLRTRSMTAALITLGCSIGVNLPPMMAAAESGSVTPMTAESLKWMADHHKLPANQVKLLQGLLDRVAADKEKLAADQLKLEAFQNKLTAEQLKLKTNQVKLAALQQKIEAAQLKLKADQQKLVAEQQKLAAQQQKLD